MASVPPGQQQFPRNDDWAYSKGAFTSARGEGIHYYGQPSMPLLEPRLLTYPVIRAAGESQVALRLGVVVLPAVGVLAYFEAFPFLNGHESGE
jgi:hypothetical protein